VNSVPRLFGEPLSAVQIFGEANFGIDNWVDQTRFNDADQKSRLIFRIHPARMELAASHNKGEGVFVCVPRLNSNSQ